MPAVSTSHQTSATTLRLGGVQRRLKGSGMSGFESALALFAGFLHLVTAPAGYGIAVWVLAIIFVWSGVAKLRRPTLAAMAITDFGVLRRVRPRLGSALGGTEVLLALFLVTGTLPMLFLPVTAGLLWLFVLLIARSLWSGKDFACFCFGEADSKLSRWTLVRTAALAVLASLLVVAPLRGDVRRLRRDLCTPGGRGRRDRGRGRAWRPDPQVVTLE